MTLQINIQFKHSSPPSRLYMTMVFQSALFPFKQAAIFRLKSRWSDVSPHPVNRASASQSYIKSSDGMGTLYEHRPSQTRPVGKTMLFPWLSKIIAAVTVPLKASDWPSVACGSWLGCVFREGGREWNAAERKGIRVEGLPSSEAELKEREARHRASQNTKHLNFNTHKTAEPRKTGMPPLFCSCTGKRKDPMLPREGVWKAGCITVKK